MATTTGQRVLRATGIVGAGSAGVAVLGFGKNLLAAYYFGTSLSMDTYFLALVIPDMVQYFSITGLFNFIPLFAEARAQKGLSEAWLVAGRLLAYWLLVLSGLLAVALLAAVPLSWIVAPGLEPGARVVYLDHTRLLTAMAFAAGAARILSAVLTAQKRFGVPALAEFAFQAASVAYLVVFHELGTMALAGGMVFGGFCQLLVNAAGLRAAGAPIPITLDLRHPVVGRMLKLSLPVYLGNAGAKVNQVVIAAFGSTLSAGGLSALQYSFAAVDVLGRMMGQTLSRALFPFLADQYAQDKSEEVTHSLERSLVATVLLTLPAGVGLGLLAYPVVVVVFQRGSFDASSAALTTSALQIYAPALVAFGVNYVLSSAYFARGDTLTPMKLGFVRVFAAMVLCSLLVPVLGHRGIALATTASEFLKLALMLAVGRLPAETLAIRRGLVAGARLGAAAIAMAAVVWPLTQLEALRVPHAGPQTVVALAGAIVAGGAAYFVAVRIFTPSEFAYFRAQLRRLSRRREAGEVGA